MAFTKEHEAMLKESRDTARDLKVVLLGKNSDKGLVGKMEYLAEDHSKLKRVVWTLIGILIGSGVISGATVGIINSVRAD